MYFLKLIDKLGEKENEGMLETQRRIFTNRLTLVCLTLLSLLNPFYLAHGHLTLWMTNNLILFGYAIGLFAIHLKRMTLGQVVVSTSCNLGLIWVCSHLNSESDLHFILFFSAFISPFLFSSAERFAALWAFASPIGMLIGFDILRTNFEGGPFVSDGMGKTIEMCGFIATAFGAFMTVKRITENLEFMVSENLKKNRLLRSRQESLTLRTDELDATLEALPDACLRITSTGVVRAINGSVRGIWKRNLRDKTISSLLSQNEVNELLEACKIANQTGKVQTLSFRMKKWNLEFHFEARISAVGESDFIINVRDETARNKQSEHLRLQDIKIFQSSKMATLGEMAGNIAHEINNPLSVILGLAEIMEGRLEEAEPAQPELRKYLTKIMNTSQRIAKIVLGLKHFARDGTKEPLGPIDLNNVLDETLTLCENSLKTKGVKIRNNLGTVSGVHVKGRSIQLSQVFLNLIGNAADAICELEERSIELNADQIGNCVKISVTDSGMGISPEVAEKLFNPFFTTKEVGKGTGLGLSISKAIIESMDGTLTYDPQNKNTTFCVTLIRHSEKLDAEAA